MGAQRAPFSGSGRATPSSCAATLHPGIGPLERSDSWGPRSRAVVNSRQIGQPQRANTKCPPYGPGRGPCDVPSTMRGLPPRCRTRRPAHVDRPVEPAAATCVVCRRRYSRAHSPHRGSQCARPDRCCDRPTKSRSKRGVCRSYGRRRHKIVRDDGQDHARSAQSVVEDRVDATSLCTSMARTPPVFRFRSYRGKSLLATSTRMRWPLRKTWAVLSSR
jgi:hypothetical protein